MKWLKRLYHFLGGVHLAIGLIATAGLVVIIGTLLESKSGSHLYAAQLTYNHPYFSWLLALFFLNILFSTTRRWPFKGKHIPFLITHLGLLMIIAGAIIKNKIGLQGNLSVWEGSGNQNVLLPYSYALHIEDQKGREVNYNLASLPYSTTYEMAPFDDLKVKIIHFFPHVSERWESWIKGDYAYLSGVPPLPVTTWSPADPLPPPILQGGEFFRNWQVLAVKTDHKEALRNQAYFSNLHILPEGLEPQLSEGLEDPHLFLGDYMIPLEGEAALIAKAQNQSVSPRQLKIRLQRPYPLLVLAENSEGSLSIFLFDTHGRIYNKTFPSGQPSRLVSYDQGFGGYAVPLKLPDPCLAKSLQEIEQEASQLLKKSIQEVGTLNQTLIPPLELFRKACDQCRLNFSEAFVGYLKEVDAFPNKWAPLLRAGKEITSASETERKPAGIDDSREFGTVSNAEVISLRALTQLDWESIPVRDQQAIHWIQLLFQRIRGVQTTDELYALLTRHRWPHLDKLDKPFKQGNILTALAQQVYVMVDELPHMNFSPPKTVQEQVESFSAYLKAFGIDYQSILPVPQQISKELVLESPLTLRHRVEEPLSKLEDNLPAMLVEVEQGAQKQRFSVAYDPTGFGFKWPLLNGRYLVRFQPQAVQIPHRIRLRQARQINYPQTQQAYSYEADVWITEKGQPPLEKTLSMNKVHETWDGYRFYLAGMSPLGSEGVRRAQIVVNYDPAKYYLTYPGALLVALGILLLWHKGNSSHTPPSSRDVKVKNRTLHT